jgi:hypothetical protein
MPLNNISVLLVEETGIPGEYHNANSAIFQLYHDENKYIFNEIMMMSALY